MNTQRIFRDLKVFIVDDDHFCSNIYKQELLHIGFSNFYLYKSGEECLNNLSLLPDIIIVDYDMATIDGLQLIQKIKKAHPYIYMLMVSGQQETKIALNAIEYGASAYIHKDGNELAQIRSSVNKIVSKYQQHYCLSKHLQYARHVA
jgi:DNA-binding NarL/FixJ family response regulator